MGLFNPHASNRSVFGVKVPDFGLTELVGGNKTTQGGSNLFGPKQAAPQVLGTTGTTYGPSPVAGPQRSTGRSVPQPQQQQQSQPQQGGQQGPSTEDQLNAVYNPINDFLNQMAQEYEGGRPEAEAQIGTSFDREATTYANKEATEIGGLNSQEGVVNREEANALAQARQLFNELSQRNVAMFGAGSSAGPAAQEILGRDTSRKFGSVGETATAGRTTIEGERTRVKTFTAQKKAELETQKQEAIRNVQKEFREGLLKINGMKAQNESAKASARLELLQQAQQQAFEIEQADKAYARAIDQFEREKAATSAQVGAYQSQQGIDSAALAGFQRVLTAPIPNATKFISGLQMGLPEKLVGTLIGQLPKEDDIDGGTGAL